MELCIAPDHPVIRNMERTGYPDGKEPRYPVCPVCGEECETLYIDCSGKVFGCDECITTVDAWDIKACFPDGQTED